MHVLNVVQLVLISMKTKIKIKGKQNSLNLIKETKEERKERIKYASTMVTRVVPNKTKLYSRKKKYKQGYEDYND